MRHNFEQELQISEFIKDPASLKLLILAGTNIRSHEIATVNKCTSLIKLDLSSNQLTDLPLRFASFPHLRILYLHDNQLTSCPIAKTNLDYVSLFDNPLKDYRRTLIELNEKLLAVDLHVVTKAERIMQTGPKPHTMLKWPIVEISQSLEQEEDYLNLLKAELFVITQVHKRANYMDSISGYLATFMAVLHFQQLKHTVTNLTFFRIEEARKAADHWVQYTAKKAKLRRILAGTKGEELLLNSLERAKRHRSQGVGRVMDRFLTSVRERMKARRVLERAFSEYRLNIPAIHQTETTIMKYPLKLYFRDSQLYSLEKVLLFARKMFFNRKQYDLCDNFDQMVIRTKKSYYIFRQKAKEGPSFLMQMLKNSMGLVLGEKNIDRRSYLYNRRGHKGIQIKRVPRQSIKFDATHQQKATERLDRLYSRYDTLQEYEFKNEAMFITIFKLIRYFNSGNSSIIMQNQAAYFQTEVIFPDKDAKPQREKITVGGYYFVKRVLAANAIQKWWRRLKSNNKLGRNILGEIKVERAHRLLGKWLRDLTFRHRMQLRKMHSFGKSTTKDCDLYMQLQIYMNLPTPTDLLRLHAKLPSDRQYLYKLLHFRSEVEIVEMGGRSWLKVRFPTPTDAYFVQKELSILTYRYYFNGTYLRMFSLTETNFRKELQIYEYRVKRLFNISVAANESAPLKIAKKIEIDNPQPFFIWPLVEQGFAVMFKSEEVQSIPISVFIYNKSRRPLKVNCDLLWTTPPSIYYYRRKNKTQVRVRTPRKEKATPELGPEHYLPHVRHKLNRERQFSVKQHKSLLQANRQKGHSENVQLSLLSETLNIKRQ